MKRLLVSAVAVTGLTVATAACSHSSGANASEGLTGQWRMTSLEVGTEGKFASVPYSGQVIFTDETMSVQAMNPDTSVPNTPLTVRGYEAYYGGLTTNSDAGTFSVTVESAAARDLIGQTFYRKYTVDGDTLILTPSDPAEGFRVTYERQSAA